MQMILIITITLNTKFIFLYTSYIYCITQIPTKRLTDWGLYANLSDCKWLQMNIYAGPIDI